MYHEITPYNEGWDCYDDGGSMQDNPYDPGDNPQECDEWDEGYFDAEDSALEDEEGDWGDDEEE